MTKFAVTSTTGFGEMTSLRPAFIHMQNIIINGLLPRLGVKATWAYIFLNLLKVYFYVLYITLILLSRAACTLKTKHFADRSHNSATFLVSI